jgi:hypothetical protein
MSNARMARQGMMHQQVGQMYKLAHSAAAIQFAAVHGGNPSGIIAAIFKAL